ncbi:integrator complex subunit 6 homolog [Juglans microcarpa x Juglans regia]|uniref:integrator complex subunit 6 homolog n=1 Tax=Juglans microcarpa x Juglans regia TaxID=2249226 RepID=UPI001B7E4B09|nr:integrator complex subunit 6 homolog [Juglans microcarpa x Juglans regia]
MGSCISKCRPKKHPQEQFSHIQDKRVVSQAPKTPSTPHSNKVSPSPLSPTSSTSSVSSLTCTASNTTTSSSLSSSASSVLSSKDRSFSNEFLWSCVKENPHVVRINSVKENSALLSKVHIQKTDLVAKPIAAPLKHPQKAAASIPQKRVRSSSPKPLTRQKSFRRNPEWPNHAYSTPSRTLKSPSPSRRYNNGDRYGPVLIHAPLECHSKHMVKPNTVSSVQSSVRKENLRPTSPKSNSSRLRPCLRNRETCIHRIGSKIDEMAVGKALSDFDIDSIPMEDIDNPLISLDCFIFV